MGNIEQIKFIEHDISMLKELISDNDTSILRLIHSKNEIINEQEHLFEIQGLNNQPELTPDLWNGHNAKNFIDMRDSIKQEFKSILDLQIEVLIDNISMKITHLTELNKAYENKIYDKEIELNFYHKLI